METSANETRTIATQPSEIDRLVERFTADFRAGKKPQIESYLEDFSGDKEQLLAELASIEIQLRREAGESIEADEYLQRFPDRGAVINSVLLDPPGAALRGQPIPVDFGEYRLIRKIGQGGMGVVYEAEQKSLGNRRIAIKTIKSFGELDQRAIRRFQTEVDAVAQLEHRHIVPVLQVGCVKEVHFYAMKFIEGNDLRELIRTLKSAISRHSTGKLAAVDTQLATPAHADPTLQSSHSGWSKGDTLASNHVIEMISREGSTAHPAFVRNFAQMGSQIADALHHAHQHGVVHRDIKPANLLLDVEGDAWLTDFGLAMIRDQPEITAPGSLVGTYHYMSPEQAMGSKRVIVDHRTDIYSLGVTLYELLTLQRAFPGGSREEILRRVQFDQPLPIRKVSPRVPIDLETIVAKAMAKDPNARFQSANEMAVELRRFLAGKPLTIRPPSKLERLGYWARANRQIVASLAVVCLIVFIAAILSSFLLAQEQALTLQALEAEQQQRAEVEKQKDKVTGLLEQSEGLRLAANSLLQVKTEPDLALRLGMEAAERYPGVDAHDAIRRAHDDRHLAKTLSGHNASVGHVSFNRVGSKLVTAADSSRWMADENLQQAEPAIVWDLSDGQIAARLQNERTITSAVFSPDDALILVASSPDPKAATNDIDSSLPAQSPGLWDATTYRKLVTFKDAYLFEAHRDAFSPDNTKMIFPVMDNQAAIYFAAGTRLLTLKGHERRVVYAAFSPTGELAVTYSADNTVRVWDTDTGDERFQFDDWRIEGLAEQPTDIRRVRFTPDGRRLLIDSRSRGIELRDLENDGQRIDHPRIQGGMANFFANGDLFAFSGGEDQNSITRLSIRDAYDASAVFQLSVNQLIRQAVASPDGRFAGILHYNKTSEFQLWNLDRRELVAAFDNADQPINSLDFSPDSEQIATASNDGRVQLWHVADGRDRATYRSATPMGQPVHAVSPDGSKLSVATVEPQKIGKRLNFETPEQTVTIEANVELPATGGDRFVSAGDGLLKIHAIEDGRFLGIETPLRGRAIELAINREGNRVAAFTDAPYLLLWSPDSQSRQLLSVDGSFVNELKFQPDGKRLFATSNDGKIRIWNASDGELVKVIANEGQAYDLAFSPDGKRFAVTIRRGKTRLFDASTLEPLRDLGGDISFSRLRFSSDGRKLITYQPTKSSTVAVWDTETGLKQAELEVDGHVGVDPHPTEAEVLVWSSLEGALIWNYGADESTVVTEDAISGGAYANEGSTFYVASLPTVTDAARPATDWPDEIVAPQISRWRRQDLNVEDSIEFPFEQINRILVSDQGDVFALASRQNQVINYDVANHQPISTVPGHFARITRCLPIPGSERLLTTAWDGHVSIWNIADGSLVSRWNQNSSILDAALSKNGGYLITGGRDGNYRILDLQQSTASEPDLKEQEVSDSPLRLVRFSPSADRILVLSTEDRAYLFNHASGEELALEFDNESVLWAEFAPDESSLLVVPKIDEDTEKPIIRLFPLDGAEPVTIELDFPVLTAHFHPNSRQILTATRSGNVAVHQVDGGNIVRVFRSASESLQLATFDPSGDYVFALGFNQGTIWRMSDGRMWMTVEDAIITSDRRHTYQPFGPQPAAAGKSGRLFTRRSDSYEYRDWALDPLMFDFDPPARALTESEKIRFHIETLAEAAADVDQRP